MVKAYVYLQNRAARTKDEGATAVEYGLMVALIAVGIMVAVVALEDSLSGLFNQVANAINAI